MSTHPTPASTAPHREIISSRLFDTPRELVYDAFRDSTQLALWWGPDGFTNTIDKFDFRPGGEWRLTMHGPNGVDYDNESEFVEVNPPSRVVYIHLRPMHRFQMSMDFAAEGHQTRLTWRMLFDTDAECDRVREFVVLANEQNFDRLAEHLKTLESSREVVGSDREMILTRVLDAPRELVWKVWTEPEHVAQWWGPNGFSTTIEEMDVRPGGTWKHTMHGPDGMNYPNKSVFKEVVIPERIVFTHGGGREDGSAGATFESTWTFEALGDKTRITLRAVFPTVEDRDRVIREFGALEGGKQTLTRLAEYLKHMSRV